MKTNYLTDDENFAQKLNEEILPWLKNFRHDFAVPTEDGYLLNARCYVHPTAKGLVCISHGFCEYIDKYLEVIYNFMQAGYSVAICEHRGHGFSHRLVGNLSKVHIENYNTYVADYHRFVSAVRTMYHSDALYLFGHSMGGCIAALYLEQYPSDFDAAILSSPMLELDTGGKPAPLCMAYAKQLILNGRGKEYFSKESQDFTGTGRFETSSCSDPNRWQAWYSMRLAEPHYQTNSGTIYWVYASLKAIDRAIQDAPQISVPLLLCQAGRDNLIPANGQNRFALRCKKLTFRRFPFSKHEIFNADPLTRLAYWQSVLHFYASHDKKSASSQNAETI